MSITPPAELLRLPPPWNDLRIHPQYEGLPAIPREYAAAVDVLRRCLRALTTIPKIDNENLPEDLQHFWSLFADSFLEDMPTFDTFGLTPFEEYFIRDGDSRAIETAHIVATAWLARKTSSRANQALIWIDEQMRENPHQPTINDLCDIAEKYWQVDEQIRYPLFLKCARLDPSRARTLFQQILSQPNIDRELREVLEDRLMIMQLRADERQAEAALPAEASGVVTDTSSAATHQVRTKKQLGQRAAGESETNLVPNSEEVDSAQPTKTVSPKIPKKTP